ncbi:hypothetical protein J437_LFUL017581 [Ladona fulva]|uniref:PiggyBac transposable element-derived protein domain-containing protein n=1 Tax=Ladona fulva TaxID=123851 RepID=A0A8K0PC50_LADFU|nr:hypothetical protein J437_LFUL017581 [Ladona fulva]
MLQAGAPFGQESANPHPIYHIISSASPPVKELSLPSSSYPIQHKSKLGYYSVIWNPKVKKYTEMTGKTQKRPKARRVLSDLLFSHKILEKVGLVRELRISHHTASTAAFAVKTPVKGAAEIFVQEEEKPSSPPDTPENPTKKKHFPMQLFEEFFSDDEFAMIMEETTRYATCKKRTPFNLSIEDLKIFLGILIFSSYHTLPSERDYWSDQEDLGVPLVRDAMSRNTYLEIKSVIHFQNNAKAKYNKNDIL